jgi:hypothetical protein
MRPLMSDCALQHSSRKALAGPTRGFSYQVLTAVTRRQHVLRLASARQRRRPKAHMGGPRRNIPAPIDSLVHRLCNPDWQLRFLCPASRPARLRLPTATTSSPAICFSAASYTTTIPIMFKQESPSCRRIAWDRRVWWQRTMVPTPMSGTTTSSTAGRRARPFGRLSPLRRCRLY